MNHTKPLTLNTIASRTSRLLLAVAIAASLAACSDNQQSSTASTGSNSTQAASTTPETVFKESRERYASVVRIDLNDSDIKAALGGVSLADINPSQISISKPVSGVDIKAPSLIDGELRFIAPSDPGVDQTLNVRIALAGINLVFPVVLSTIQPTAPNQDGDYEVAAELIVTGLKAGNVWEGGALKVFSPKAPSPLNPDISAFLSTEDKPVFYNFKKLFKYDLPTNSFKLSAADASTVYAQLPYGTYELSISFADVTSNFAAAWGVSINKPNPAAVKGQLLTYDGAIPGGTAGLQVSVYNYDLKIGRVLVPVDSQGRFSATQLVPGNYTLEVMDIKRPVFWKGEVTVGAAASKADTTVQLRYDPQFYIQGEGKRTSIASSQFVQPPVNPPADKKSRNSP